MTKPSHSLFYLCIHLKTLWYRNHIHNYEIKFKENHNRSKNVSATPLSRKWQHHSWEQTWITLLYKIEQAHAETNAQFIHFNVPGSHLENLMIIERHLKFFVSDRFTVICPILCAVNEWSAMECLFCHNGSYISCQLLLFGLDKRCQTQHSWPSGSLGRVEMRQWHMLLQFC